MKKIIIPGSIPTADFHQHMLGAVGPRPIAFVSTIDEKGNLNLAPYSFFNAFSSNPPILVFSSNRRVANNTTKDTLHNAITTKEVVINVVTYPIVRQMSLTSVEFDSQVNEFEKAGFAPEKAEFVKAPLLKESPINMECKVNEIIQLGKEGGAGHLIICEILAMHIDESVLDNDRINPHKLDLMGRMGRAYYVRASGDAIHTIYQSVVAKPIGWDGLPKFITQHESLSGNEISEMAALENYPGEELILNACKKYNEILHSDALVPTIKNLIAETEVEKALTLLLASHWLKSKQ
jgi:flavin reductase (DIM6/NTAB) family NADH-FMN oxidoreductase RutF